MGVRGGGQHLARLCDRIEMENLRLESCLNLEFRVDVSMKERVDSGEGDSCIYED